MAQRITLEQRVQSYMTHVFGWMSGALALSGITAYTIANVETLARFVFENSGVMLIAFIAQLALVMGLSFGLSRMSAETAALLFWGYSFLTGVTLSSIFLVYTQASIASTFLVAAGMFGIMAIYGATTDTDLTGFGSFLTMALFGLLFAMIVNWFLASQAFEIAISLIGVLIFTGLTAYDVQVLRKMAEQLDQQEDESTKITIVMALRLYLDFLNLFLFLLQLMGNRRR